MRRGLNRRSKVKFPPYQTTARTDKPDGSWCEICGNAQPGRRLAQDHCHLTGINRGKLCTMCNLGLGNFMDDTERLRNAIRYLWHYGK